MAESGSQVGVSVVGCYSLHLYCTMENSAHDWNEFPHEYTAELGSRCRQQARQDGWWIHGNKAICPKCNRRKRKDAGALK